MGDTAAARVLTCSGSGSTTAVRTITAQLLHHYARGLLLNAKRISHPWARELPTVTYQADNADIHDALVDLATELRRRTDHAVHADRHGGDIDDLPRLAVVFEAADVTLRKPTRYWDTVREEGDPKT
ncbi:hypothetical protein [Streptomyces incanus]|uniref:Uncharacterized protein n=1 Tax=Streptomyces incanus TaxID=887453 RepID=A0ABW0XZU5_9ACTN